MRRCFFHYIRFPDQETLEKIEDKILLDHYKADLNISKILSYAGYVKNSTTQIQELNAENPDTPSRIFETKDEALEDLKQRAINELTNRGISKREATKTKK